MVELDNLKELEQKLGIENNGRAEAFFTATCYKAMDKYVPMDKNLLRRIVYLDTNSITYMSNYASYQYFGFREDGTHEIKHWTTPGTGPYWDKRMMSVDGQRVIRDVQKFIERG